MARYTELFSEWLENGGKMPAVFDNVNIDGEPLADIFTAYYAAREIGFETPALFELKFNALAAILINDLQAGLQAHCGALAALSEPKSTHTKSGALQRNYGDKKRNTWENPTANSTGEVDLTDVGSQGIVIDKSSTDTETYENITDTDTVKGVNEGVIILEALSQEKKNYLQVWLEKFEPLFMQIF